jgi:hypothetical protein
MSKAATGRLLSDSTRAKLSVALTKHGMYGTRTYKSWVMMKQRCNNPKAPKYRLYGGRGISVCRGWATFEGFFADMGERPEGKTLDRIDNDGDYEPANCRWATASEQNSNRQRRLTKPTAYATMP